MEEDPKPKRKKVLSPEQIHNWNVGLFSWGLEAGLANKKPLPQVLEVKKEYGVLYASGYYLGLILSLLNPGPEK